MTRRNLWCLALMLVATGCSLAPEVPLPATPPVAQQWPASTATTTPEAPLASTLPWEEYFQSPPLRAIITRALAHQHDLRIATLNIEKARALYRIERSALLPSVDAVAKQTRQDQPPNPASRQTSANLAITAYELDLFGRVQSLNEAALQTYFAAEETRRATQISLIAETANAYLQWLADHSALNYIRQTVAARSKAYALTEASVAAGMRTQLDLAQAETALETAKAAEAAYQRAVAQDENALTLLVGADTPLPTAEPLEAVAILQDIPVGLPSSVLLTRPDVMAAEHQLRSMNAQIGAARAAFFPTISLTGSYGFSSTQLSQLFSSGAAGAWSFIPQITLPIFAGGAHMAALDAAETDQQIALTTYEKTIETAFREVADALIARETLQRQLEAQQKLVAASARSTQLSQQRYDAGMDSYLSVLDAQTTEFAARLNAISIQQQQLATRATLYKTLGGGALAAPSL